MNAKQWSCVLLGGWLFLTTPARVQASDVGYALHLAQTAAMQTATSGSRREADELLRRARAAIREDNLPLARWCLERAEKMDVEYDGLFRRFVDTPDKLRRDLEKLEHGSPSRSTGDTDNRSNSLASPDVPTSPLPSDPFPLAVPFPSTTGTAPPGQLIHNPYVNSTQSDRGASASTAPASRGVPATPTGAPAVASQKARVLQLLAMARAALDRGEIEKADTLARQAHALPVPVHEFARGEVQPWMLLLEIDRAKRETRTAGSPAGPAHQGVRPAIGNPLTDNSRVQPAAAEQLLPPARLAQQPFPGESLIESPAAATELPDAAEDMEEPIQTPVAGPTPIDEQTPSAEESLGYDLLRRGEAAVKARDFTQAQALFRDAWKYETELDPAARQRLQDNLQLLRVTDMPPDRPRPTLTTGEEALVRRFSAEISQQQSAIRRMLQDEPKQAWQQLTDLRQNVADAEIPDDVRRQLLARVDRSLQEAETYIDRNRARIELDEHNRSVVEEIDRRRQHLIKVDDELASMVDEFNSLMDQERFSEAVVLAKKARELSPDNPTVESMIWKSRFAERLMVEMSLRDRSQLGVEGSLTSVVESGIPWDDRIAIQFPEGGNAKFWEDLTRRRKGAMGEAGRQLSETELEIQRALRKKVQVDFTEQPLSVVLGQLGDLAGVSIYLDPLGLAAEAATSDVPVTIHLNQELQLKSALNIILEQYGLSYVIQDDVLKVTSESIRASKTFVATYDVGDLVIPIPNFQSSYNVGLPSAIREAYSSQGWNGFQGGYNQAPLTVLANHEDTANSPQSVLAQISSSGSIPGGSSSPQPLGLGPGGLGGGAQADFDTLIELITATIAPDTWDDVGGEGSIQGFPTNLSLVVSQTQEVHEQIADLLEQLRRLQDLQVTIEVRFITLNDNFFERIGVDFDFDIDAGVDPEDLVDADGNALPNRPSVTIGLDPQGNPTADLDLSFTQDGFGSTIPAFGGFDPAAAANFGFAILSDIEAFFVIQAAQGDTRTNVLQAPKVTLFNGQQASVNDNSQRPFVTSVTPVVGDFAAAQAPVIVVLSEGTSLNVQAVVSNDRRFVRLTLVPFFSKIGDVEEFTFEGRRSSSTGTAVTDPSDETQTVRDNEEEIIEGTTVQLPQFAFTSVSTTVSVPDGGTILLGGIKRLSEGRNERGVPMLGKLPYINRLFKNVGIGRTTQSLMMMVTPRIIIQEEEESKLGIALPSS